MKIITLYDIYHKYEKTIFKSILYICILIGLYFVMYQSFYNMNIWNDESALAVNIINRTFNELLQPLWHSQVAPIAYLYMEKFLTIISGKDEHTLRFFALFSYIISIPMTYLVAHKLTNNKTLSLFAATLFSINITFVWYANQVKQYSSDVLFTLIIIYLTLTLSFEKVRSVLIYGVVGAIAIWFSNPSIIILATSGLYLLIVEVYKKRNYKILYSFILLTVSFIVYYMLFIYNHPAAPFMKEYWKHFFFPIWSSWDDMAQFLNANLDGVLYSVVRIKNYIIIIWILFLFFIIYTLARKNYKVVYFIFMPLVLHLILSGYQLYPFNTRLVLYILSLLVIFYAYSLYSLYEFLSKIIKIPILLLLIPTIIMLIDLKNHIPINIIDIRTPMVKIKDSIKPTDDLYVYSMSNLVYRYYNDSGLIPINHKAIVGSVYRGHNYRYNKELLSIQGKAWLLFGHVFNDEEDYMISFLTKKGAKIIEKHNYLNSSIYYIDTTSMDRNLYYPYYLDNFYGWEGGKIGRHGWSSGDTELILPNSSNKIQNYKISFKLLTIISRRITIKINGIEIFDAKLKPGEKITIDKTVDLNVGDNRMTITTDKPSHRVGRDPRLLSFAIDDLQYSVVNKIINKKKSK